MNHFLISGSVTSLTTLGLAIFVLAANPRKKINQCFALYTLSIALWSWAVFKHSPDLVGFAAVFWGKILHLGAILIPLSFLFFVFELLGIFAKEKKVAFGASSLALFFILANFFSDFLIKGTSYRPLYCFPTPGIIYGVFFLYFVSSVLYSIFLLVKARGSARGAKRNQLSYLVFGSIFGYLGGLDNFLITIDWLIFPFYPYGAYAIAIYTLITAYAITKTELMDIRLAITRGAAYGIVGGALIASFIGLTLLRLPLWLSLITNPLLALFWALAAHRLRLLIQTPLEEKWVTDWYDSDRLINRIAQALVPVMEREQVLTILAESLREGIKIKKTELFSALPEKGSDQDVSHYKNGVLLPLISSDGFEGAIFLGPKLSEDPYNDKDFTLFRTVRVMTQAIFDRIRPYEKIRAEFEANQKKLYDTERLLARSERLASLANLIREYNHEVKTPLSIIRGETSMLVKEPRDLAYLENFKKVVLGQIDRANDIVESTLRLSQPKERAEEELDLNEVIKAAIADSPLNGIAINEELAPLPRLKGDRKDLEMAFINLLKNAVEAMPGGGTISIRTGVAQESGENKVVVEISDSGVGISKKNLEKIFEPFFSTHVTKGRGLGLSIVFRIVREHLGSITVKSEEGKGTVFCLSFPVGS